MPANYSHLFQDAANNAILMLHGLSNTLTIDNIDMMIVCSNCGIKTEPDKTLCPKCGCVLAEGLKSNITSQSS